MPADDPSQAEISKKTARPRATYAAAGVDRDRTAQAREKIKLTARRSFNKNVLSELGGYAGLFSLDTEKFPDPVLVSSADGVGSKLQLAGELGQHAAIGADLVNHCVNDIAVQGATPLFFLDYFAAGEIDPAIVQQVVSGMVDACKANGCALIGGETSEMPTLYRGKEYDLAGFIVGVASRSRLVSGDGIEEGDVLLALPSTGLHTNGYTLARKLLFQEAKYRADQYINEIGDKVGAALMRPHRSYLSVIRKLMQAECVRAFAHITGGGLSENLPRILPKGMAAQVELTSWEQPPLFTHLKNLGSMDNEEMFRTFNMGIGLVAVVPAPLLKKARLTLSRSNERCMVIGRVVRGPQRKVTYI